MSAVFNVRNVKVSFFSFFFFVLFGMSSRRDTCNLFLGKEHCPEERRNHQEWQIPGNSLSKILFYETLVIGYETRRVRNPFRVKSIFIENTFTYFHTLHVKL